MNDKTKTSWLAKDEHALMRMYGEGLSAKEIAATLGRSEKAVQQRLHILRNLAQGIALPDRNAEVQLEPAPAQEFNFTLLYSLIGSVLVIQLISLWVIGGL